MLSSSTPSAADASKTESTAPIVVKSALASAASTQTSTSSSPSKLTIKSTRFDLGGGKSSATTSPPPTSAPVKSLRFDLLSDKNNSSGSSRFPKAFGDMSSNKSHSGPSAAYLGRRRSSLPALKMQNQPRISPPGFRDDSSAYSNGIRSHAVSPSSSVPMNGPEASDTFDTNGDFMKFHGTVAQRRRSSASSTASLAAITSALTYSPNEIYAFLLVSKELAAATEFVCQLMELGGLTDEILLCEFKTILIDLMAERFSTAWDIRVPKKGAAFRTIQHSPNLPNQNADPILRNAFTLCNIHPKHLTTLLPVSFTLIINPGLVAYMTSDVEGFQPVHLFEARPYLPPKHQEPVDHGAEMRVRALRSVELGHVDVEQFDVDSYFGGRSSVPARRPSVIAE